MHGTTAPTGEGGIDSDRSDGPAERAAADDRRRPRTDGGTDESEDGDGDGDGGPTVLLVDDEENVVRAYELWLDGYDVVTATGGTEALERVGESVDVVLLDRRMPDTSGDEVLAAIRERGLDVRVAMVTAVDPDFDVVDMAFDDYLTKPVTRGDLRGTVDRLAAFVDYDATFRDYFAVARKVAALESAKPREALADSTEYEQLTARRAELRSTLDETVDGLDADAMTALFDGRPAPDDG